MPAMSKALNGALNDQIRLELSSAYLYLAMSTLCADRSLRGSAHWLRLQWEEELGHATKLIDYVQERGGSVELRSIDAPAVEFHNLTRLFEAVLDHEGQVTTSIYALCRLATDEQDFAAATFLQWFVSEQVEEENAARDVLDLLRTAGDQGPGLILVDQQLGQRTEQPA
jgi:ferritin